MRSEWEAAEAQLNRQKQHSTTVRRDTVETPDCDHPEPHGKEITRTPPNGD